MWRFLMLYICLPYAVLHSSSASHTANTNCLTNSLYCRGSRLVRNVMQNLSKSDKPVVLVRGLEIVPSQELLEQHNKTSNDTTDGDESFLGRFSQYLRTHELNIKFSDLLAEESERQTQRDLEQNGGKIGMAGGFEEGRKKDKGQGMMMAMGMMFGKMMAVLGLGGIGALAMKALGVSMLALMMAAMVGMKSLADKGHESSHSVQYLTGAEGHHRRRRRRSVHSGNYDPLHLMYRGRHAAKSIQKQQL